MAGEGLIAHKIASLKENKRSRTSTFDKIKEHKKQEKTILYFQNKATPEQLQQIREQLQKEQNVAFLKKVSILTAILIVILGCFYFLE